LASLCIARSIIETIAHTVFFLKKHDNDGIIMQLEYCTENGYADIDKFYTILSEYFHSNCLGAYDLYANEDENFIYVLKNPSLKINYSIHKELLIYIDAFNKCIKQTDVNDDIDEQILLFYEREISIEEMQNLSFMLEEMLIKIKPKISKKILMYKMEAYINCMLSRCFDLSHHFYLFYKYNLLLGSYIIARSLMDTIITFIRYHMLFSKYLEEKNIEKFKELNSQYIFSEKNVEFKNIAKEHGLDQSTITNVLSQMGHVHKKYDNLNLEKIYCFLSQHIHVKVSDCESSIEEASLMINIIKCLECFISCYNELNDSLLEKYRTMVNLKN
jgi:hypothetical protein